MTGIGYKLWAKSDPHHYLWRHLLDVAAVAKALLPRFGPLEEMPTEWACYLCALHDIGKADPWFQNKDPELAQQLRALGLNLPAKSEALNPKQYYFRHEARSSEWLFDYLMLHHGWGKRATQVVMHSINGHHGNFGAEYYDERKDYPQQYAKWQPLRAQLAQRVWDVLRPPTYTPQVFGHAGALGAQLAGLVILADWIASNADIYDYTKLRQHDDSHGYFEAAQRQAAAVVAKMKLDAPVVAAATGPLRFTDVWPDLTEPPRPSQKALENEVLSGCLTPGLAIIEAPMGEGKTEGAIYLGEHWNAQRHKQGLYLGLPTQATSNQIHQRYTAYLKARRPGAAPRLVHGMAWLIDDATPTRTAQTFGDAQDLWEERLLSREWFRPLRRALLAPDGVGTVDQVLLAALHVKFGVLRLLGLRAKVLVVDEAHAYDAYMTTILQQLLKWCRALEIPVILLSATLSARQKKTLVTAYGGDVAALATGPEEPYPLLTFVPLDGKTRSVPVPPTNAPTRDLHIEPHYGSLDDAAQTAQLALTRIKDGGCACVLMNTVKGAQAVFSQLIALRRSGHLRGTKLLLFHARFRAQARSRIEWEVGGRFGKKAGKKGKPKRPRRAILVATQVVEQSLDVDFDFLISQLAPLDLLLQRSGRLWRHNRQFRFSAYPTLDILLPNRGSLHFGVSKKVYAYEVLLRTLVTLHECAVIHLPTEFRPLIEAVYGEDIPQSEIVSEEEMKKATRARQAEQASQCVEALKNLLPEPDKDEFELIHDSAKEQQENEAANYLRASTRLGDDTRAALILSDIELLTIAKRSQQEKSKAPRHEIMLRLFKHKVNLPCWWLKELEGAEGYETIFEGKGWLRHLFVVPAKDGQWRACTGDIICDDLKLGLTFIPATKQQKELDKGEADAGLTG